MKDLIRFHSKIVFSPDGCWIWGAAKDKGGYGVFGANDRQWRAHRYAYFAHIGSPPDGLVLHHDCRNKACVNPAHLIPVTNWQNVMADDTPARRNALASKCVNGHPLDRMDRATGKRYCTKCKRERKRKWDAAHRTGYCKKGHDMSKNFGTDIRGQRYCMKCKEYACAVMRSKRAA